MTVRAERNLERLADIAIAGLAALDQNDTDAAMKAVAECEPLIDFEITTDKAISKLLNEAFEEESGTITRPIPLR